MRSACPSPSLCSPVSRLVACVTRRRAGKEEYVFISGGFADVNNDVLTVLAESAELAQDIDTARAMAAKERAEKRIADHAEQTDVTRAEAALHRALIRLQVAQLR